MEITYWSDYACPYCYIGETRLKKAIKAVQGEHPEIKEPITLKMRAFRLDPSAGKVPESDTVTRFAKKYRMSPMLAAHQIEKISLLGQREGLEFNYAGTKFTNTKDAHRLTKYAYDKSPEIAERLIELLFQAYFSENEMLSEKDVLVNVSTKAGLDADEVNDFLDGYAYAEDVVKDERDAYEKGVTGVPYFEINGGNEIYGAEQTSVFKRKLEEILLTKNTETDTSGESIADGHVYGKDGCKI